MANKTSIFKTYIRINSEAKAAPLNEDVLALVSSAGTPVRTDGQPAGVGDYLVQDPATGKNVFIAQAEFDKNFKPKFTGNPSGKAKATQEVEVPAAAGA